MRSFTRLTYYDNLRNKNKILKSPIPRRFELSLSLSKSSVSTIPNTHIESYRIWERESESTYKWVYDACIHKDPNTKHCGWVWRRVVVPSRRYKYILLWCVVEYEIFFVWILLFFLLLSYTWKVLCSIQLPLYFYALKGLRW